MTHGDVRSKDYEELRSLFQVVADAGSPVVRIDVGKGFDDGLAQAENVAEHALVEALVAGISTASGESANANKRADLVGRICPNSLARWTHRIMAHSFRDFIQASREKPVLIDSIDDAANRLGLAWTVHSRDSDSGIRGVSQCKACLNAVVRIVLDRLCAALKKFDRRLFVNAVLQNHEAAAYDRDRWKRTAQANLAR